MKTVNYHKMGSRIRKQRELLGYTREQLAEKPDVSPKFCSISYLTSYNPYGHPFISISLSDTRISIFRSSSANSMPFG